MESKKKTTEDFLKIIKQLLLVLPGAFTKVCSAKHLPGYVNNYDKQKNKGIIKNYLCIC